jgi:hypothetical protein
MIQIRRTHAGLVIPAEQIPTKTREEMIRIYGSCEDSLLWTRVDGDPVFPGASKRDEAALRAALYDAREMGLIPSETHQVTLPGGKVFQID